MYTVKTKGKRVPNGIEEGWNRQWGEYLRIKYKKVPKSYVYDPSGKQICEARSLNIANLICDSLNNNLLDVKGNIDD